MQVAPKIDKIWYIRQGRKEIMKKTSFIVVGPMSSDNKGITGKRISLYLQEIVHFFNFLTVSLLFDQLTEYLEDGCILLIIRPVRISGKDTSKEWSSILVVIIFSGIFTATRSFWYSFTVIILSTSSSSTDLRKREKLIEPTCRQHVNSPSILAYH